MFGNPCTASEFPVAAEGRHGPADVVGTQEGSLAPLILGLKPPRKSLPQIHPVLNLNLIHHRSKGHIIIKL